MARSRPKKAITLRLDAVLVDSFREFVRDYAGKPYYLTPGTFIAEAISNHLTEMKRRIEGVSTAAREHHSNSRPRR